MRAVLLTGLLLFSTALFAGDLQRQGRDYLAGGEIGKAAESFSAAASINPFDPVALNNLAVAKAAQGDYQTALALLERASKLAPSRPDIAANLASLKSWLGGYGARGMLDTPNFGPVPPDLPPLWKAPGK